MGDGRDRGLDTSCIWTSSGIWYRESIVRNPIEHEDEDEDECEASSLSTLANQPPSREPPAIVMDLPTLILHQVRSPLK
jgi:hypothetical protein